MWGFTWRPAGLSAGAASLCPDPCPWMAAGILPILTPAYERGTCQDGQAQPRRQRAGSQEPPGTGEPGLDCITAGAVTSTNLLHLSRFASSP